MAHTLVPIAAVVFVASVLIVGLYGYVGPYIKPVVDRLQD